MKVRQTLEKNSIKNYHKTEKYIQKDWKNLERAVGGGWNPVTVSPHPKLKVNSYGYISHGDVVLCGRILPNMLESEAGRIQDENIKRKRIS